MIRIAAKPDLEQILDLAEAKREQYAGYQPQFHHPTPDARRLQRPYLEQQIDDKNTIALVDDDNGIVDGFIIASMNAAPLVYDPGGLTAGVDDFMVREPRAWPTLGRALLDEVRARARERGAAQVIVVCGPRDKAKRDMLVDANLTVASEWFVGPA